MWYYARSGQQFGPVGDNEIKQLVAARQLYPNDLVWREGMPDWQPLYGVRELYDGSGNVPPPLPPTYEDSRRIAAGVFALLLGSFGVHKFYLGMPLAGAIMLLSTILSCGLAAIVVHTIAIIEGIIYLTKSDAQFYQDYVVDQRQWF